MDEWDAHDNSTPTFLYPKDEWDAHDNSTSTFLYPKASDPFSVSSQLKVYEEQEYWHHLEPVRNPESWTLSQTLLSQNFNKTSTLFMRTLKIEKQ